MQEAIECVDLLSLRIDVVPSWSESQRLSDRLARAEAAYRMVAAHTVEAKCAFKATSVYFPVKV